MQDETLERVHAALKPWRELHRRDAWRPLVEERHPRSAADDGSQFGGLPLLHKGEAWPICEGCRSPMQLFLQLNLRAVPTASPAFVERREWIQLFHCVSLPTKPAGMCEAEIRTFEPFAGGKVVRVISAEQTDLAVGEPPAGFMLHACRAIVGWKRSDDFPSVEEHESFGIERSYESRKGRYLTSVRWPKQNVAFDALPLEGVAEAIGTAEPKDKLGGWPYWVQSAEYPSCPRCGSRMEYVFQIDSEDNVPYMFGDAGCGHITRCPAHPDVLTFAWACC